VIGFSTYVGLCAIVIVSQRATAGYESITIRVERLIQR